MTEKIFVDTDDIFISEEDSTSVEAVRKKIYNGMNGEEAEVAICVWMYTAKRLDKLRNCINSILKYTTNIKYKLVLTNNGGGEEIAKFYESIDYPDKLIINISSNISSPHGFSTIMKYVRNKYCVELLNDSVVTSNWLDNMLKCMKSDDKIGMVCPMSTNTSNMQEPEMGGVDLRDHNAIQEFAIGYNISDPRKWEERIRLMPICALYRRETIEMTGIADPGYLHEYSDDDYCLRIRRAGYKLMLCGDTTIHHDHFLVERNTQVESYNSDMGKNGFIQKFNGLEPWEDFINFVFPYLSNVNIQDTKEGFRILGIDVKCGTPILDVKNCYRHSGIDTGRISVTGYTKDAKYYPDLLTVCDEVICGDIHCLSNQLNGKYDFIVMGHILNGYNHSMDVLDEVISRLEEGGYLLCSFKNVYNIDMLLALLGNIRPNFSQVEAVYYLDIVDKIRESGVKKTTFFREKTPFNIQEIEMVRKSMVEIGVIAKECENATKEWDVCNYWFLIQK